MHSCLRSATAQYPTAACLLCGPHAARASVSPELNTPTTAAWLIAAVGMGRGCCRHRDQGCCRRGQEPRARGSERCRETRLHAWVGAALASRAVLSSQRMVSTAERVTSSDGLHSGLWQRP
eukprot:2623212-Rhodomonas_salina.1